MDEIAGYITKQASLETTLQQGTPVTVGTIDAAAEAISSLKRKQLAVASIQSN